MVCGRGKWRLGSAVPLCDEMLAGTGMADDCGLAFLGDFVCLGKFMPGRDTIFQWWPGLRDDGGWLGLRGGSFRPMPLPRNNTLHRSRRAARLFDRQLTHCGPVNVSVRLLTGDPM